VAKSTYKPQNMVLIVLLRRTRVSAGLTQQELAEAFGKAQNFVSEVERGTRRLDLIQVEEWCIACETDLKRFVKTYRQTMDNPALMEKALGEAKADGRSTRPR
jgi:transcriptional regulator with XRE-family HTH domain